jgi:hypothetical protein
VKKTSDRYNEVIEAYLDSDLEALYETLASRPAVGSKDETAGQEAADKARHRADQEIDKKSG